MPIGSKGETRGICAGLQLFCRPGIGSPCGRAKKQPCPRTREQSRRFFACYINSPRLLKISTQKNTVMTENVVVNTTCAPARSSLPPICCAMG